MIKLHYFLIAGLLLCLMPVQAQDQTCGNDPYYQLLDFWVGKWNVYDLNGELAGTNDITKILEGCAISENWEDPQGNKGISLFYVDNNSAKWKQVWVTQNARRPGGQKEKTLVYYKPDSILVFQGVLQAEGKSILDRTILTNKAADEVQQTIQISRDGGQNWETLFDAIYRK